MKKTSRRSQYRLYPTGKVKFLPLRYNGVKWEAISVLEWRRDAREILAEEQEEGDSKASKIRSNDLDEEFGDIVTEDVNIDATGLILQQDGTVLELDEFHSYSPEDAAAEDLPFVHPAEDYEDRILTMQFGATYRLPHRRLPEDPIRDYFRERINDQNNLMVFYYLLCHALTGRISVKAITMLLNIRFNTGKSVGMFILFKLFGSYAVKVAPQLFHKENIERLNKFLFVHKDCLLIIIDETDAGFRPDIPTLKKITGRDLFANSYASTFQDQFAVRGMLFVDSNEVMSVRSGGSGGIENRLFLIPFGTTVAREDRIWGLEHMLTEQDKLDTFFSNLLDDHFVRAMSNALPPKTPKMERMDLFFRVRQESVRLFLELCTVSTESNATMGAQNYNTLQVHQMYVRFTKRFYAELLANLRFNRDDHGQPLSFHKMNLEVEVDEHRDFKAKVDRIMGEANELGRFSKGYRWTTFVVKELVVMYLTDEQVRQLYGPMEQFVALLDRMKSGLDGAKATQDHLNTIGGLKRIATNGFEDPNFKPQLPGPEAPKA